MHKKLFSNGQEFDESIALAVERAKNDMLEIKSGNYDGQNIMGYTCIKEFRKVMTNVLIKQFLFHFALNSPKR